MLTEAYYQNPHEYYKDLRLRGKEVIFNEDINAWMLVTHDAIKGCLRNTSFTASRGDTFFGMLPPEERSQLSNLENFLKTWLLFSDGDRHVSLRKMILGVLKKSSILERCQQATKNALEDCLSSLEPEDNHIDGLAIPVSLSNIEELFGVSSSDYNTLVEATKDIVAFMGSGIPELEKGLVAQSSYQRMLDLIELSEVNENSFMGELKALYEENQIAKEELLSLIGNFVLDGHEPTALAIGHAMLMIGKDKTLKKTLETQQDLIPSFISESMRLEPVFPYIGRRLLSDTIINESFIPENSRILAMVISGNRDESVFTNSSSILLGDDNRVKKSLSFGYGSHFCIGQQIARQTINSCMSSFINHYRDNNITPEDVTYRCSFGIRGFDELKFNLN